MSTRLAIHRRDDSFSTRWIEYCEMQEISYKVVNCYDNDILAQIDGVQGLLWEFDHTLARDALVAKHILRAAEMAGIDVFPDSATCWHFDDKLAQKYLLEAIGAPLAAVSTFYRLEDALCWIGSAKFPAVFKLRKGAGSGNVKLVRTPEDARKLAATAFGKGFKSIPGYFQDAPRKFRRSRNHKDLLGVLRRMPATFSRLRERGRLLGRERGYIYFQEFVPGNTFDTRVTVIGNRAFAFTRNVSVNDFRASGSGSISYDLSRIDLECIRLAFQVSRSIGSQSAAFDFIRGNSGEPVILEVSYDYRPEAVHACPGYWDPDLNWREGQIWPEHAILQDLIARIDERASR